MIKRAMILALVAAGGCAPSGNGQHTHFARPLYLIDHPDPFAAPEWNVEPYEPVLDVGNGRLLTYGKVTSKPRTLVLADLRVGRLHSYTGDWWGPPAGAVEDSEGRLLVYRSPGPGIVIGPTGRYHTVVHGSAFDQVSYDGIHFHLWGKNIVAKTCRGDLSFVGIELHDGQPPSPDSARGHRPTRIRQREDLKAPTGLDHLARRRVPLTYARSDYRLAAVAFHERPFPFTRIETPEGQELLLAGRVLLSFGDRGRIWAWSLTDGSYQQFWSKAHLLASERLPWLRRAARSSR
ncbi:MAG: hypothetical protein KJO07_23575 [Deltaproteobacteria bacterium]|nr:hypothetical protein [Deltaproteobacteria bacterium]